MKNILSKIKKHKFKINTKIVIFLFGFITFFNLFAIISKSFATWYREYIFTFVSGVFSRVTGIVNISVGEVMICLFLVLLLFWAGIFILGFFKVNSLKKIRRHYTKAMVYVLLFIYWTETFHCFILYHTATIEEELYSGVLSGNSSDGNAENGTAGNEDIEKLLSVYNEVTDNINELSLVMKRDSNGELINDYTYAECKEALWNVSDKFKLLEGYYPNPKKIYYSDIMSQQYLAGIYFPFSMEANYNKRMYISNNPSTICHELSHLKGYIREDEANFISFAACINSENDFIRYSGYLSVYYYLLNDLFEYGNDEIYERMESLNAYADADNIFLRQEDFEEIEENSIISTEVLSEATDKFIDSNLKINGVKSGMDNYNEVVRLLLLYYECEK